MIGTEFLNAYLAQSSPDNFSATSGDFYVSPEVLGTEFGEVAMTRAQALQLLNKFKTEALRRNITPSAFSNGLFEIVPYAKSPNAIRAEIRNTLASPVGRLAAENPELVSEIAESKLDLLRPLGVNPEAASRYVGLGGSLVKQLKKEGLLRSDVTNKEITEKIQKPLYGAVQQFVKENKRNASVNELIRKAFPQLQTSVTPIEALMDLR